LSGVEVLRIQRHDMGCACVDRRLQHHPIVGVVQFIERGRPPVR
jgi:hypothetical protein